jgi:hypothetical protein
LTRSPLFPRGLLAKKPGAACGAQLVHSVQAPDQSID